MEQTINRERLKEILSQCSIEKPDNIAPVSAETVVMMARMLLTIPHPAAPEGVSAAVQETVWPAEVSLVYSQIECAGDLPAHHQSRLKHHINRMWLEKMPVPAIVDAARSLASAMEKSA